jgi:hypothetical protein
LKEVRTQERRNSIKEGLLSDCRGKGIPQMAIKDVKFLNAHATFKE